MGLPGADCSHPIDGAALLAAGKQFVIRYQSSIPGPKVLLPAEAAALTGAGVGVGQVYEDLQGDAESGTAGGEAHGAAMVAGMRACATPAGVGAYFADDKNRTDPAPVVDYFTAAAAQVRPAGFRPGYYGSFIVARALLAARIVDLAWVVATWHPPRDEDTTGFSLAQLPNSGTIIVPCPWGPVECDQDETLSADDGLWWPTPRPAPAPPTVTYYPEDQMAHVQFHVDGGGFGTDDKGNGYSDLFDVPAGTLVSAYANTAGYAPVPFFKGAEDFAGHVRIEWKGDPNLPPFDAHAWYETTPPAPASPAG